MNTIHAWLVLLAGVGVALCLAEFVLVAVLIVRIRRHLGETQPLEFHELDGAERASWLTPGFRRFVSRQEYKSLHDPTLDRIGGKARVLYVALMATLFVSSGLLLAAACVARAGG